MGWLARLGLLSVCAACRCLPDLPTQAAPITAFPPWQVPEMRELLPDAATKALQKVGIEVAAAGSTDKEAAAAEEAAASLDAASRDAAEAAAAAVSPEALPDLWEQEMEVGQTLAWGCRSCLPVPAGARRNSAPADRPLQSALCTPGLVLAAGW